MDRSQKPLLVALLGVALLPAPAVADTVDATLTTLLSGHAEPRDGQIHTVVPVYQLLSVLAKPTLRGVDDMKIVVSAWGGVVPDLIRDERVATGDIDVGYVEGAVLRRRIELRLGRQLVFGGAARNLHLDGLHATVRMYRGLGLSVYGGAPVTPRFGVQVGDVAYGGRLFYRYSDETEIGASFTQLMKGGQLARQQLGIDARYVPHRTLALSGYALLSVAEGRLAEADLQATWLPHAGVQLSADYRRTAPDLFIPRDSIFSVFSQETRDEFGTDLYLRPLHQLRVYGDYHLVSGEAGLGHRGGGKLSAMFGRRLDTSLNAQVHVLHLPDKGYVQVRLYAMHTFSVPLTATVGADTIVLEQPINGQTISFTATATAGYDLPAGWRFVLAGLADTTPYVTGRFEVIAKIVYNHTLRFREVRK